MRKFKEHWPAFLITFFILLDSFWFVKLDQSLPILTFIILWIFLILFFKKKPEVSVFIALFLVIICPFLLIFKKIIPLEKVSIWIFIMLLFAVCQSFLDSFLENVKTYKKKK